MSYAAVKEMMQANDKVTREEVMEKVGCTSMQAAAWMQRFKAEDHFAKHPNDPFLGRYKGGVPTPKRTPKPKPKKGQQ